MDKKIEESLKRLKSLFNKYNSLKKEGKITEAKEVGLKFRQERKNLLDLMNKSSESDQMTARLIKRMKKIKLP